MNFAVIGVGGYIAPRHLKAIRETGHCLVAATDPHDAVGVLDSYGLDVRYFPEIERFDRHIEKLRRGSEGQWVHFVTVCSPNYLHDAHCRLGLRVGADVICEKPVVINPWNIEPLQQLERETGRRIFTVLQLRHLPALVSLREALRPMSGRRSVSLAYVTGRGRWYQASWKGVPEKSGGIAVNIGIHLFDLLVWLFGPVAEGEVHLASPDRMGGWLELERARVRWYLSTNADDLPKDVRERGGRTYRALSVDDRDIEFSEGFTDLHTRVYEEILAGRGLGLEDARPSIELAYRVRHMPVSASAERAHPLVRALER